MNNYRENNLLLTATSEKKGTRNFSNQKLIIFLVHISYGNQFCAIDLDFCVFRYYAMLVPSNVYDGTLGMIFEVFCPIERINNTHSFSLDGLNSDSLAYRMKVFNMHEKPLQ